MKGKNVLCFQYINICSYSTLLYVQVVLIHFILTYSLKWVKTTRTYSTKYTVCLCGCPKERLYNFFLGAMLLYEPICTSFTHSLSHGRKHFSILDYKYKIRKIGFVLYCRLSHCSSVCLSVYLHVFVSICFVFWFSYLAITSLLWRVCSCPWFPSLY